MKIQLILAMAVGVLAVVVRVEALRRPLPPARSGTENERVAAALAAGQGWANAFDCDTGPTAHSAPLYPLLLAGIYRLCGDYETDVGRYAQRGLSIALSVLALLLLPVVAGKLGLSPTAGWLAAFAAAWFPPNLRVELTGRHESVAAVLALLGLIWCLADLRQRGWSGWATWLRTGGVLGLIALLAPNFLLVPILFFAAELVGRGAERGRIVRCGFVVAAISFLFVAPWMVRNYRVLGGFVPLRSNFGLELAVGNRPDADGHTYTTGMDLLHPYTSAAERTRLIEQGELAYMRDKQRQAVSWIGEHPRQFVWLMARRARLFWITTEEVWLSLEGGFLPFRVPMYTALAVVVFVELLRLLRENPPTGRLLSCVLLGAGLPYLVTHVEQRYRLPLCGLYLLLNFNLAIVLLSRGWSKIVAVVSALRPQPRKIEGY
jgi:hypothetical protein